MTEQEVRSLVSPSDIAEMTGKSRAAVSNWRKRHEDFPRRVDGSDAKPLFDRVAVEVWLKERGYHVTQDQGEKLAWAAMNALRGELEVSDAGNLFLTLCCLRKWNDQSGDGADLRHVLLSAPSIRYELQNQLRPLSRSIDIAPERLYRLESVQERRLAHIVEIAWQVDAESLGSVADYVLERFTRSQIKSGADSGFVGSRTATLLSNLAVSISPNASIYDPACGVAVSLIRAYELGTPDSKLYGSEINPQVYQWAKMRMYLHDVPIQLVLGDTIFSDPFPNLKTDAIILEPPFGGRLMEPMRLLSDARFAFGIPPRNSADLAWVQLSISHLNESGTAFVLTPAGPLFRERQEQSIRMELVRQGCVEAIVGLPGRMLPQTSIPLFLWVLRPPRTSKSEGDILFIDASAVDSPETVVPSLLSDTRQLAKVPHSRVTIADVLAEGAKLTPDTWLKSSDHGTDEVNDALTSGWQSVRSSLDGFKNQIPDIKPFKGLGESRIQTIGDLAELGLIEIQAGRSMQHYENRVDQLEERYIAIADIRDPRATIAPPMPDESGSDPPECTQPGDILVTTTHRVQAWLDSSGGHLPGNGVYRLRVTDPDLIRPTYLQVALEGPWNQRFMNGTTIQRASIKNLEIPIPSGDAQEAIWASMQWFHGIIEGAQKLADGSQQMQQALLNALRYGIDINLELE